MCTFSSPAMKKVKAAFHREKFRAVVDLALRPDACSAPAPGLQPYCNVHKNSSARSTSSFPPRVAWPDQHYPCCLDNNSFHLRKSPGVDRVHRAMKIARRKMLLVPCARLFHRHGEGADTEHFFRRLLCSALDCWHISSLLSLDVPSVHGHPFIP